jgi:small subunit ribosomal protein S20
MPNLKSAKKALRQAEKKAKANKIVKDAYKKALKTVDKGLQAGKDVAEDIRLAQKKLDKAAKKGVIKKNTASRKLSRLVKRVQKASK